jgi:hypothetical protein
LYYQFLLLILDNGRIAVPVEKVIGLVSSVHDVYMVLGGGTERWAMRSKQRQLKKEKKKKKRKKNQNRIVAWMHQEVTCRTNSSIHFSHMKNLWQGSTGRNV